MVIMFSRASSPPLQRGVSAEQCCSNRKDAELTAKIHPSPSRERTAAFVCHLSMLCFYAFVHVFDAIIFNKHEARWFSGKGESLYGGRWKFLTYINLWVQLVYFAFSFCTDIIPWSKVKFFLHDCCTIFFTTLALPMALLVAVTFWAVYAIDRELIYPAANDEYIPFILNHFWHTTVLVCVLLELAIVFHRFPTTKTALLVTYLAGGVYLSWVIWVFSASGRWPYPFIHVLPFQPLFFMGALLLSPAMFFCGKGLCYLRWRRRWH